MNATQIIAEIRAKIAKYRDLARMITDPETEANSRPDKYRAAGQRHGKRKVKGSCAI
jgi:hypothetical protein